MNVQTIFQIYRLLTGTYDGGRYITVANLDTGKAAVVYAKKEEELVGIIEKNREKLGMQGQIYAGSGMFDARQVEKTTKLDSHICFIASGEAAIIENTNKCKGCGKCNRACPAGVSVKEIVKRRELDSKADISDLGSEKCIQCKSCTFVCRAGKNVHKYMEK